MTQKYRTGQLGVLMDEYEKAAHELKTVVQALSQENYIAIADHETTDPDCRSFQKIMNHVVRAGYAYANYIRKQYGNSFTDGKILYDVPTPAAACKELDGAMAYTLETLNDKWNLSYEELAEQKILTRWGVTYDVEQLLEHAIVHLLRHRRQIEKLSQNM